LVESLQVVGARHDDVHLKGAPIRRGNARRLVRWNTALTTVGLTGVRFDDLRHTGNTLAARSGVSTRDLMGRMGHDSVRAAMIYQHATTQADARIADSLDADIAGAIAGGGLEADEFGGGVVLPFG
jgi:integrase